MDRTDIESNLAKIIANYTEFDMSKVVQATSLREEIGLSSFDIIALVTEIEETFAINIDDYDIVAAVNTFGEAADMIAGQLLAGV